MKAGIMVDSLGTTQLALQLILEINKVNLLENYIDVCVFYHYNDKVLIAPNFALFHEQEAWGYNGPVMATSLETAHRLLKIHTPVRKLFYVWDLQWIHKIYSFEEIADVYCNDNIDLIARSESHAKIISLCWKEPVGILRDFNYEQFASIINQ